MMLYLGLLFFAIVAQTHALLPSKYSRSFISRLSEKPISRDGYGLLGSLTRQGPVPVFIRLVQPDTYEAAVKKYMALEKCDRTAAQANMDAYFQDPNGWAGQKLKAKKEGRDDTEAYVNANQDSSSLLLTGIWAFGIIGLFVRILQVQVLDK